MVSHIRVTSSQVLLSFTFNADHKIKKFNPESIIYDLTRYSVYWLLKPLRLLVDDK